jgi:hypothetical protein
MAVRKYQSRKICTEDEKEAGENGFGIHLAESATTD